MNMLLKFIFKPKVDRKWKFFLSLAVPLLKPDTSWVDTAHLLNNQIWLVLTVDYRAYPLLFVEVQCVMLTWITIQMILSSSCHPSLARAHSWSIFAAKGNYDLESYWRCCIWRVRNVCSFFCTILRIMAQKGERSGSADQVWSCYESPFCWVKMMVEFFSMLCVFFFLVPCSFGGGAVFSLHSKLFSPVLCSYMHPFYIFCVQDYIHLPIEYSAF